ncbi:MAG TPA: VOC family protein [Cyclobacteriaceae bacterium]|nr:VOC family protein [Cyclobacteriaceae bacterium]
MNPVVHFELPYKDGMRIAKFYKTCFGWKITELGEQSGSYILAQTAIQDAKPGFPAGSIDGGFFPVKPDWPSQYPSVVIGVEDIHEAMKKIAKNGGTVLGDPMTIPNFGIYVSFLDTEGNRNSIIQPQGM